MSIKERIIQIKKEIATAASECHRKPEDIQLVAVSKKHSVQRIWTAIQAGVQTLGENYIQEARDKIESIGSMIQENPEIHEPSWHFIGHLQRNKAKYAVRYFDWIHSVDSQPLMEEINRCASKHNKRQNILIQVSGGERQKSGISPKKVLSLIETGMMLKNITICGLMIMPPFTEDPEKSRPYFQNLARLLNHIKEKHPNDPEHPLNQLSMGMTSDFHIAIQEGATFVRVGTAIFGKRESCKT